jgi:hypothetical protein
MRHERPHHCAIAEVKIAMGKKKKCSYRRVSDYEIKKMKAGGLDPHDLKPSDDADKWDLAVCKPSGKIAIHRKYFDLDGTKNYGGDEFDDCPYQKCHHVSRAADGGGESGNAASEDSRRSGERRGPVEFRTENQVAPEAVFALQTEQGHCPNKEGKVDPIV